MLPFLVLGLAGGLSAAPLRVIDETAIPFTSFLSKADFDRRYPGELIDAVSQLDRGWYVIYRHESLNYYFGPILLESIGQDYLDQLSETVNTAVGQRPSIQGYRLELSYEPKEAGTRDSTQSEPSVKEEAVSPYPQLPSPQPKPSFWGLVKRIFGFG